MIHDANDTVKDMSTHFKDVLQTMETTFEMKNSDYGSSVDITYLMFGEVAPLVRLWDKLLRITQVYLSDIAEVKDEALTDTLLDLANYSAIFLAQRRTYDKVPDYNLLGEAVGSFISSAIAKRNRVFIVNKGTI